MADIPSFFGKADFYGVLLPGYLVVTLYLLLFRPDLIFGSSPAISADIFSAVVFVILGPAVGLGLQQLHRRVAILFARPAPVPPQEQIPGTPVNAEGALAARVAAPPGPRFSRGYYRQYMALRSVAATEKKAELDLAEAQYDFSISVAIAFVALAVARWLVKGDYNPWIPVLLVVLGVMFLAGGIAELAYGYWPMYEAVLAKPK